MVINYLNADCETDYKKYESCIKPYATKFVTDCEVANSNCKSDFDKIFMVYLTCQ